jgi:putative ABC transport system permease protein
MTQTRLLRVLLAIIDLAQWLAPPSRRRAWRRQWRADIWHEWRWTGRQSSPAVRATLVGRTAGAVRHAFWLRLHVRKIEMLTQDLRYGWRLLLRKPGFTAVAVLTLGVGIGATITIFSLMNAVLLRPLTPDEPDRVVRLASRTATGRAATRFSFSFPDFADIRERATTLAELSGANLGTFILSADNRTDQILGEIVSGRYLAMLGARMTEGRPLGDADDRPGATPVVVIGDSLRQRRFGPDTVVVGRQVLLTGTPYTIVGVVDRSFGGSFIAAPVDLWMPIESSANGLSPNWKTDRASKSLSLIGRLKPGVTVDQARTELQTIAGVMSRELGPTQAPATIDVLPGTLAAGEQRRLARVFLSLLLGLVALVLAVACANVGNLMLARVLGRRRELAVRVALGASRARLAWMLLTETALVAVAGGVVALIVSVWSSRLFSSITPLPTLTLRLDLRPDARVIGFAIVTTLAAAAVLATVGAFQAMRADTAPALKEDTAAAIGGRSPARLRATLAAAQITVSLVLLIGAALFVRSARNAEAIALGFETRGVLATDLDGAGRSTPAANRRLFDDIVLRVSTLPTVEAAAVSTRAPLDSSTPVIRVSAREAIAPTTESAATTASVLVVSPRYFDVVRTPIVAGRSFGDRDDTDRARVVIVNETLAARLWPNGDAIGRRLWLDPSAREVSDVSDTSAQVIGVARNSKYLTLGEENQGHIYLPFAQHPRPGLALLIRSSDLTDRLTNAVQEALRSVDPNVQGFFTRTLTEHVSVSMLPVRLAAQVAAIVATLALALAVIGLYSLLSFLVAERTHEIGLRMALGADAHAVVRLVVGQGVRLAGIGLAVGIPAALASSRLLGSLLYGVSARDPLLFAMSAIAVLIVSAIACYLPARRAASVDPLVALRRD